MKQLMEVLGVDIPKWDGPVVCENSTESSESANDVKPRSISAEEKVKKEEIKEERKREATWTTEEESTKGDTVSVKRERADLPLERNEDE